MRCILITILILLVADAGAANPHRLQEAHHTTLRRIHQAIEEGHYSKAGTALKKLLTTPKLPEYDRAMTLQTLGYLEQRSGNNTDAVEAYLAALGAGSLPDQQVAEIELQLGRLFFALGNYLQAVDYLERWRSTHPEAAGEELAIIGYAWYRLQKYPQAIPLLEQAIATQPDASESWYLHLLECYRALGQEQKAIVLLSKLVELYPDHRQYWDHLLWSYQRANRDAEALAVLELMQLRQMLDADGIKQLAAYYRLRGMPYRSAMLLQQEITSGYLTDNLENRLLLADSWRAAKEPLAAIRALASKESGVDSGRLHMRLGEIYLDQFAWSEAKTALRTAIGKGGLKNRARAWAMLALAQIRNGDRESATYSVRQVCASAQSSSDLREQLGKLGLESWIDSPKCHLPVESETGVLISSQEETRPPASAIR